MPRLEAIQVDLVAGLSQQGSLDMAAGGVLRQRVHGVCSQDLGSQYLLFRGDHQAQRVTQEVSQGPGNPPEHGLIRRPAVGVGARIHGEGCRHQALVELSLRCYAPLVDYALHNRAQQRIAPLDLSQPTVGLGPDNITSWMTPCRM